MLGFSSGANPRSIAKSADGVITEWFWTELSLTPMPSNPYAIVSVKSGHPVIGIKSQHEIFKKLGRLPNADEAMEHAAGYQGKKATCHRRNARARADGNRHE